MLLTVKLRKFARLSEALELISVLLTFNLWRAKTHYPGLKGKKPNRRKEGNNGETIINKRR